MLRFIKSTLSGELIVALGLSSAGCGGETSTPVKPGDAEARKAAGMEKYNKRQQEIAEQMKAAAQAQEKADADKDKDKDKEKEKKDKDKE